MMKKLVEQNIYALLTPLIMLLSGLVISLLFTRILSQTEFGVFTTLIAFTMLFTGISDMGISNTFVKTVGKSLHSNDGNAGFYMRYLTKLRLVFLIITSASLMLFSRQLSQIFLHSESFSYTMQALGVLTILFSINQFVNQFFTAVGRFEYPSLLSIILNGSKVVFPLLLISAFGSSLQVIVIGVLLSFSLAALASVWLLLKKFYNLIKEGGFKPPGSMAEVNSFLFYSAILAWASFFSGNVDSLLLNYFRGPSEIALFRVSFSVVSTIISFLPISSTFLLPFLVQMEAKKQGELQRKLFDRSIKYGLLASIPLLLLVFLTANRIIFFFWPSTYMPAAFSLRILSIMIPFSFLSGICMSLFMSKGKMKELTFNTFVFYVFTWAMGLYLISNYGLYGTALTFVLSSILQAVVLLKLSLGMLRIPFKQILIHISKASVPSLVTAAVILLLNPLVKSTILLFVTAGVLFCIVYIPLLDEDDKKLANTLLSFVRLGPLF